MPSANPNYPDAPVLVLAPHGRDALNAAEVLRKVNIRAEICASMRDLCDRAGEQTGALLVTEETLDAESLLCLMEFLAAQPQWSNIPMVLLTTAGEITQRVYDILNFLDARAHVTLLERPLRAITLISVTRAALRSRHHQYEVRDLLESYSLAMEGAQMGSWDADLTTGAIRRSLRHDQIFGYETLQPEWNLEKFLERILEPDREHVRATLHAAQAERALYFECRIRQADGKICWIAMQGRAYGDEKGKPRR